MVDFFYNTLSPWQWALLALVPPAIIALYFLKLRRQPLEVPSTYLWKRTIEDLHVNSLWQRLRQNLLLFLQLLLIGLAMFALLRPGWQGTKLAGDRFIFLVDNSASMSAADVESSANRLEEAKKLTGNLIDQMEPGMTAMIISFADTPQVVQEFTDNRRLLRERLATIEPSERGTDLRGALELADGLANPGRITTQEGGAEIDVVEAQPATLYILSDGRFEDVKNFALGNLGGGNPKDPDDKPIYIPIGSMDAVNLAITAFSTRRSDAKPEERQAFVQVSNFTEAAQSAVVEIQLDGSFLDAKEVDVPAGESAGVVFPLADAQAGKLTAQLKYELATPTKRDVVAQDDKGYAALNDSDPGRVLVVTPGNVAVEVVLATQRAGRLANIQVKQPEYLETPEYARETEGGTYDLVIYDQCQPKKMPRADTLFVGRLPPISTWHKQNDLSTAENDSDAKAAPPNEPEVVALPQLIDWDRSHPLLSNVELANVDVGDSIVLDPPSGATVLIDSTAGPIAAIAPRDAYQDAVLGFEIVGKDKDGDIAYNTNWPRRLSFPTFWLNALEYLAGGTEEAEMASVRPGRPVQLRAAGNVKELTVVDPNGKQFTVPRTAEDIFQFHDTSRLGVYEVRQTNQLIDRFAVNLFDRQESNVRLQPSQDGEGNTVRPSDIRIGNVDVAASLGRTPTRKEAWKIVLTCALAVLVIEWYIYNRRVYV
jgi:hypothetical protein